MNLDILLTILFTSGLFLVLRGFSKFRVDNFHGIVVNYFTAAACSFFQKFHEDLTQLPECSKFIHITFMTGFLFIVVFLLTAKVTQEYGVGVSSIAAKLSMVIPIFAGVYLYNESMQLLKIGGLIMAVIAVMLVNLQDAKNKKGGVSTFIMPLILFIGCGLVDTSIKYTQHHFISDANRQVFIMCMFGCAGILGLIKLLYDRVRFKKRIGIRSIAGGIILGACNYYSLYFLIRCFESPGAESSKIFAIVNLGVVITCSVIAALFFSESVNRYKVSGILLSVAAILTLYYA
jgi:drug/metabolite transporter (DMT)-like permease